MIRVIWSILKPRTNICKFIKFLLDFDILQYENLEIKDPRKPENQETKEKGNQENLEPK